MSTNDRLGSRFGVRLAVLGAMLVAMLGTLIATTSAPASAATVMKGSTRCVGTEVRRCTFLEAFWSDGQRKVRAVATIRTSNHDKWITYVHHVSLYRNTTRVTTRGNSDSPWTIRTKGTHRNGEYHSLAKFCWGRASGGTVSCRWLEGRHKYFRH